MIRATCASPARSSTRGSPPRGPSPAAVGPQQAGCHPDRRRRRDRASCGDWRGAPLSNHVDRRRMRGRSIVEQRGIDVSYRRAARAAPTTSSSRKRSDPTARSKLMSWPTTSGSYILAIAPSHGIYSGTYAIRAATRRAATDSDRSMYEARRLRTTALGLAKAARFNEARPFRTCDSISEAVRGPDNVFTGMLLHDLVGGALDIARRWRRLRRSNAARSPFSTTSGARAIRIRRWHGCGWRCCCSMPGSGPKPKPCPRRRRRSSRRRSEQSTPGLRRASGRKRVSAMTRAISTRRGALPPRDGHPGKGRG